jgi:tRNA1Val (adenine37-N6)-methyltransferase
MSNTFFKFKKFIVHQERAAMKVSTDSCVFGAWVADRISNRYKENDPIEIKQSVSRILDIGTGTGLLLLMLAQKIEAELEGVELDAGAFADAEHNICASAWKDRIHLIEGDVLNHTFSDRYDLIISNPPFYENSLKSDIAERNKAKHDESLTLRSLVNVVDAILHEAGIFAVMIPAFRSKELLSYTSERNLHLIERMEVLNVEGGKPIRSCFLFGKKDVFSTQTSIAIRDSSQQYTEAFREFLKDYYLYL